MSLGADREVGYKMLSYVVPPTMRLVHMLEGLQVFQCHSGSKEKVFGSTRKGLLWVLYHFHPEAAFISLLTGIIILKQRNDLRILNHVKSSFG